MRKYVLPLLLVGLMTGLASADLVGVLYDTKVNDNDDAWTTKTGYVVNDVVINLGTDLFYSAELLIMPTGVTSPIYQNSVTGSDLPPNWQAIAPQDTAPPPQTLYASGNAYFDTYVSGGSLSWATWYNGDDDVGEGETGAAASIIGGAVDIGGAIAKTMSSSLVDVAWYPVASDVSGNNLKIARITIKTGAGGEWAIRLGYGPVGNPLEYKALHMPIVAGKLTPEPGTWVLLICGALSLLALRRR